MQRIAGMSVTVKADGVSEAFYNGQRDRVVEAIREEMEAQKAELNAKLEHERDRADMNTKGRSRLLGERLDSLTRSLTGRKSPLRRALRAVENGWAMVCGLVMCLPEIGESLGLWERIDDDEL